MDTNTRRALHRSQVIDLTTTGRRTGQPRRIEIFLHHDQGLLFISGMPRADRTRDWIHNIAADPNVAVHLKQSIMADIPATARVVTDPAERRPLIEAAAQRWGRTDRGRDGAAQSADRAHGDRRRRVTSSGADRGIRYLRSWLAELHGGDTGEDEHSAKDLDAARYLAEEQPGGDKRGEYLG